MLTELGPGAPAPTPTTPSPRPSSRRISIDLEVTRPRPRYLGAEPRPSTWRRAECQRDDARRERAPARALVWTERRLFELLGGWVVSTPEPEVKLALRAPSRRHGDHAITLRWCSCPTPVTTSPRASWLRPTGGDGRLRRGGGRRRHVRAARCRRGDDRSRSTSAPSRTYLADCLAACATGRRSACVGCGARRGRRRPSVRSAGLRRYARLVGPLRTTVGRRREGLWKNAT